MAQIQTVKFQNPDYGDIYTAQFEKTATGGSVGYKSIPR